MLDLGFVLFLTIGSAALGLRVMSWLGIAPEDETEALALAVPTGLGLVALGVLGLAMLGVLTGPGLAVAGVIGLVVAGKELFFATRGIGRVLRGFARPSLAPFDLALAGTVLGTLLTAMAPVTDGDALCYHLQAPKLFLARGASFFDPDLHETVYPMVAEMLYAVALAARGPVACRLVQWVLGLSFAAGVTSLARPMLNDRARWAGTIALLVPAVSNGMGAPLNDVALAAFGAAALLAWTRWRDRPSPRGAAFAGLLGGLALGVKYPALVWVGMLGAAMVVERCRREEGRWHGRSPVYHAVLFGLVAVLIGGCWYLRAYVHTGNPVYPFFRQAFGGAGIDDVLDPIKRPLAVTPVNLLTAIAPMTLQPDRFDSFSHQFGPAFLLFLPGLFLMRPPRRLVLILAFGLGFLMICLCVRQSMRFVLIAVGPMSIGVAWLASKWWDRPGAPARVITAAFVLMLGFETTLTLARARHGLGVILGRESASSFLDRREPTFRVGRWMSGRLPESARVIGQDHRGFYLPRGYAMELAHRRRTGLGTRGESPGEIVGRLSASGFTHLMMCPPVPESAVEFDPTLGRLLAPWLAGREPLYREDIRDGDGVTRRYAIYELADKVEVRSSSPVDDQVIRAGGRR